MLDERWTLRAAIGFSAGPFRSRLPAVPSLRAPQTPSTFVDPCAERIERRRERRAPSCDSDGHDCVIAERRATCRAVSAKIAQALYLLIESTTI